MSQNVWELKNVMLHRQKRRAEIVSNCMKNGKSIKLILDIGCAEGYATSYLGQHAGFVVGVEIKTDYLKIAKNKVKHASFVNASITHLPFRDSCFDGVSILEVLEHLHDITQRRGLCEADRVLRPDGVLIISVPYKEQITYTRCVHCEKLTPLYGHLHSIDEDKISALLPPYFELMEKRHLPNLGIISCSRLLEPLPLVLWLLINNLLGAIRKGYWMVLRYHKAHDNNVK